VELVSDHILEEKLYRDPAFPEIYPRNNSFNLGSPQALLQSPARACPYILDTPAP